jgi:hypothetical protein
MDRTRQMRRINQEIDVATTVAGWKSFVIP